ncbi:carboxylesterase family protein [Streptomyces spiralis]
MRHGTGPCPRQPLRGRGGALPGVPYAAPPFGPRRFCAPEPPEPWTGGRDATAYGPTAPHAPCTPPFDALIPEDVLPGEGCLIIASFGGDAEQVTGTWFCRP